MIAWVLLALTVCGVVWGVAILWLFAEMGQTMACFDGDQSACTSDSRGFTVRWPSLLTGAMLIALAAAAVFVSVRHRRGRARRRTAMALVGSCAMLNCLAAVALLSL
jgi:hypothetical protein